ncbi:MAG: hypothetical protein EBZ49_00585 [Proteobacteria bacterium]|nr:hypothetical protein [Pseudomonadota bacterium]
MTDLIPKFFTKFTPEGVAPFCKEGDKDKALPLPSVPYEEPDSKFKKGHSEAMEALNSFIESIKQTYRALPTLRAELMALGVTKGELNDLENWGYVECKIIGVMDSVSGKTTGARAFVYPTPKGRAYIKQHFKKEEHNEQRGSIEGTDTDSK